jgi:hypothetical protein
LSFRLSQSSPPAPVSPPLRTRVWTLARMPPPCQPPPEKFLVFSPEPPPGSPAASPPGSPGRAANFSRGAPPASTGIFNFFFRGPPAPQERTPPRHPMRSARPRRDALSAHVEHASFERQVAAAAAPGALSFCGGDWNAQRSTFNI